MNPNYPQYEFTPGCVFAEMILGQPLFTGKDGIDQLVEIIKVLGTPNPQELQAMNPNYPQYEFTPKVQAHPWDKVFRGYAPREANELANSLLTFSPAHRMPLMHALMHGFFDALRLAAKTATCSAAIVRVLAAKTATCSAA